jgi:hypothetical protein
MDEQSPKEGLAIAVNFAWHRTSPFRPDADFPSTLIHANSQGFAPVAQPDRATDF